MVPLGAKARPVKSFSPDSILISPFIDTKYRLSSMVVPCPWNIMSPSANIKPACPLSESSFEIDLRDIVRFP